MDPKKISILDYTYQLPSEKIAYYPLQERDQSKLLLYKNGVISEDVYHNIANHLPASSLIVFNNTRVVEARLLFKKESGAQVEIFCLEPHSSYPDITTAMMQKNSVQWMCLIGGASKWKNGQILEKRMTYQSTDLVLQARYINKTDDRFTVELSWNHPTLSFAEVLHAAGSIPLPPYIKRTAEVSDAERYQTVYAQHHGSVAAPTAGLHFTQKIFDSLSAKNIESAFVTLHVGAGTFKPVKSNTMEGHDMHSEFIDVSLSCIERICSSLQQNITAVGTTSLRTLESLYWLGARLALQPALALRDLKTDQWDPYELNTNGISAETALQCLISRMKQEGSQNIVTTTQLLIVPGYKFKIVNRLITNFHQPQSTLLLLVAALVGEDWKNIYDYALRKEFRFLSYGDGCLLERR